MATGTFTLFNKAKRKIAAGTFAQTATFKAALTTSAQPLTAAFTGTSGEARYADLTAQVANGNGYVTGGATLTGAAYSGDTGTVRFDADDVVWADSSIEAKYVVVYSGTELLGFMELETTRPNGPSSTNGDFKVGWDAVNGLFTFN